MERTRKQTRGKRVDDKRKLGTTILVRSDNRMSTFKNQHPSEFKTTGEVIDYLVEISLRVNSGAAAELYDFCQKRVNAAEREMLELKGGVSASLAADDLRARADYFKALANHMARFVPKERRSINKLPMKRVDMKDGAYAIVPDGWKVVNEGSAPSCDFAFVLEVRNHEECGVPHFVYFSQTEACSTSEVVGEVSAHWSGMEDILKKQVEPAYDAEGNMLNAKEWQEAPTIGVFPIRDSTAFSAANEAPFGAMVYRQ